MCNNILSYICFFILCGLVVTDMVFFSSVALQILCVILVCVVCGLVAYIAHKWHKGTYLSAEQQSNYQGLVSDNVALTNELNHIKSKQAKNKISSTELQNLVLINTRLTAQNSNLKLHLVQLSEQLQTAKNQGKTVVLPITPNEQNQTNIKKQKSA